MVMSLEELKRENAESEQQEAKAPQPETETEELETVEEETQVDAEGEAESPSDESEETEIEPWMQTEEQASENSDKKFTDSDMAVVRKKVRAKVERQKNEEIEALKRENEQLKRAPVDQAPSPSAPPKLEDYDYDEGKFNQANAEYIQSIVQSQISNVTTQEQQHQQQAAIQEKVSKSVDGHYTRAAQLVSEAGISPDRYQAADSNVRNMIEGLVPGQGDSVTDALISRMDEGSEKVMYYVGNNANALTQLKSLLTEDPSGISAAIYLGRKQTELTKPQAKITKAPKPSSQIKGDAEAGDVVAKLKRDYQKADKAGDVQARFDARRKAKQSGADVSNW